MRVWCIDQFFFLEIFTHYIDWNLPLESGIGIVDWIDGQLFDIYRVSHIIGPILFFAILSVSTLPKYKNLVSV